MLRRLFMVLKASPVNRGLRLVDGVEALFERFVDPRLKEARVEERIAELRQALHLTPAVSSQSRTAAVTASEVTASEVTASGVTASEVTASEVKSAEVKPVEVAPAEGAEALAPAPGPKPPTVGSVGEAAPAPASAPATKVAEPVRPRARAKRSVPKKATAAAVRRVDPLSQLVTALEAHPKRTSLVKAGREKDQLLRSLIPLYLAQPLLVEVSSGTTSRFWAKQGVKFAAPNAAKALREHEGYSKRTATGPRITPAGVKYVEAALASHQPSER